MRKDGTKNVLITVGDLLDRQPRPSAKNQNVHKISNSRHPQQCTSLLHPIGHHNRENLPQQSILLFVFCSI